MNEYLDEVKKFVESLNELNRLGKKYYWLMEIMVLDRIVVVFTHDLEYKSNGKVIEVIPELYKEFNFDSELEFAKALLFYEIGKKTPQGNYYVLCEFWDRTANKIYVIEFNIDKYVLRILDKDEFINELRRVYGK